VIGGLHLCGVEIRLGNRTLVPLPDLHVAIGAAATIMGPSGSGKSTLLAFVGGFLDRNFTARGIITIGGRNVTTLPP
jgi:putative thiamine transport system ATP-binding protein